VLVYSVKQKEAYLLHLLACRVVAIHLAKLSFTAIFFMAQRPQWTRASS